MLCNLGMLQVVASAQKLCGSLGSLFFDHAAVAAASAAGGNAFTASPANSFALQPLRSEASEEQEGSPGQSTRTCVLSQGAAA